jgi:bacterioferritin-associated ferredoxin
MLAAKLSAVRSYYEAKQMKSTMEDLITTSPQLDTTDAQATTCPECGLMAKPLRAQQRKAHKYATILKQRALTNQCPPCDKRFKHIKKAREHVEQDLQTGGCPGVQNHLTSVYTNAVQRLGKIRCNFCRQQMRDHERA